MNARFVEANTGAFEFSRQHADKTGFSTIRTVIDSQYVRKKLSIRASFLTGELVFEATSGGR